MTVHKHPITNPRSPLKSIDFYTSAYTYATVEFTFKDTAPANHIEAVFSLFGKINIYVNHASLATMAVLSQRGQDPCK